MSLEVLGARPLKIEDCLCHVPVRKVKDKNGKMYVTCGMTAEVRERLGDKTLRPCSLFCGEYDWPNLFVCLKEQYPDGLDYSQDFQGSC